jgi:CelD/BcsL family acetyltransferase involved in cellulose biosynthesis
MQFELIQDLQTLDQIRFEWNESLSNSSARHVPFLKHEFIRTWWKNLGGGEWESAKLCTIIGRLEEGALLGIAPFFQTETEDGKQTLMFIGTKEIADYLDFIVQSNNHQPFVDQLFNYLDSDAAPDWQVMDLFNIAEESPTIEALRFAAKKQDWSFSIEKLQPCPFITLPEEWEDYLAAIDKKQRHEIRRKLRRVENYEQPTGWYILEQQSELEAGIEVFFELMAQDPEKARFLTDAMQTQLREIIHAAFEGGWLQLAFLEIDGQKIAGYLNFDHAGHIWVYNSGINFQYGNLSPGWVLLSELIRWSIENKRSSVDFMRGDEGYKYKFGGIDRYVMRVTIRKNQ